MNKLNPKISIIVPSCNCIQYAPKCIESIINQTYTNWEMILATGHSKDGTTELCDDYASKYENIKVVHDTLSLVEGRNAGFEVATGDWIMYVDGDDWIDKDNLQVVVDKINENSDLDVLFWRVVVEMESMSNYKKWTGVSEKPEELFVGEECKELARRVLVLTTGISMAYAKIVRRDYALKNNLYNDPRLKSGAEDVEYSFRVFYNCSKALFINRFFYHYIYNVNSLSNIVDDSRDRKTALSYEIIRGNIDNLPDKDYFIDTFYERIIIGLISGAIYTFNPNLSITSEQRKKKLQNITKTSPVYEEAWNNYHGGNINVVRKLALFAIRHKFYFILKIIAVGKNMAMKTGYYNF